MNWHAFIHTFHIKAGTRSVWYNEESSATVLWNLYPQISGVPLSKWVGSKHMLFSAVDLAVIGTCISICPWTWGTSSVKKWPYLSVRISLSLPGYCCKCVSHLAAVCRHRSHLSPGLLLDSPPKVATIIHWRWADWSRGLFDRQEQVSGNSHLPHATFWCSLKNMGWAGHWSLQLK